MKRNWFTITEGHDVDLELDLREGVTLLGRSQHRRDTDPPGSHRMTIEDAAVSRTHCELRWVDQGPPLLIHRSETNETLVNGESVLDHRLVAGDILSLGSTVLRFNSQEVASPGWGSTAESDSWKPR